MPSDRTTPASLVNRLNAVDGLNVIFQVTDRCVLSCRYCFARGAHGRSQINELMEPVLLDEAIRQSFTTRHNSVTFEWTGGEAFLAGIEFYRRVSQFQQKHANKTFTNTVQTSGYLLDRELIDFLVDNGFHISMTIDGPENIHNFNRPARNGGPSFKKILTTRDYIIEKQGSCGAIVTVTKKTLGKEKEILDLYGSLGINYFHSNPYVYFDGNIVKDRSIALSNNDYASYFINQFNAWFEKGRQMPTPVIIDYILQCLAAASGLPQTLCAFGGRCLTTFVATVPNGDAYPCPKFTGSPQARLGNIKETALADLLSTENGPMKRLIAERTDAIRKCERKKCRYMYICNSGCPYYCFIAGKGQNIKNRDRLCKGKTLLFEYLESVMTLLKAEDGNADRKAE